MAMYVHALGASRHPPALLHAVELASAVGVRLAFHVVVIVVAAPGTDEKGGGKQRRRAGTDLLDLRDGVRKGSGVVVEVLVEPGIADVVSSLPGRRGASRRLKNSIGSQD